jgi:hypothetical protein
MRPTDCRSYILPLVFFLITDVGEETEGELQCGYKQKAVQFSCRMGSSRSLPSRCPTS